MKDFIKNLKIFWRLSVYSWRSTLDHRSGVVLFTVGKIIRFIFFFFFIFLIFSKTKLLKGYQLQQGLIIYLTFNFIDTLTQVLFREVYRFRPLVISGNLDLLLTKPQPLLLRLLLGGVDFVDLIMLFPYTLLLLFFILQEKILFGQFVLYLFLVGNALILATAFHIFVLAFGLATTEVDHTIMIYRDLTSFGRFPFEIYHKTLRHFLTFVLPIGIMFAFPPKALFGILNPQAIFLAFLISLISLWLALKFWQYSLKKYQSWGG
jgi:ABC-2 type transport system permease protein